MGREGTQRIEVCFWGGKGHILLRCVTCEGIEVCFCCRMSRGGWRRWRGIT